MTNRRSAFQDKDTKKALQTLQANIDREEEDTFEEEEETFDEPSRPAQAHLSAPTPVQPLHADPYEEEEEEEEVETAENLTVDQILERARSYEDWDIFEDVGPALVDKNDTVKYSIKKNGKHIATVEHPYSYDEIQKNFGGGSYVVTLRSKNFSKRPGGGYLTSQPRVVASPEEAGRSPAPAASEPGSSPSEMLTLLQQMNEKARADQKAEMDRIREETRIREERLEREAKTREERMEKDARERDQKREADGNSTMMLMMKMMESNAQASREAAQRASEAAQQQTQMLIAVLTKAPPPAPVEKEDKRGDKMFDLMLNVLIDKKGKGESLDPLKLQELLSSAEEKGYSRAKEIRELANEEAVRLAGRGGSRDDDDEDEEKEEKPESTTQTLLKTLTPLIAQLAQGGGQPAPQQIPRQIPRPPMMTRPPMQPRPPVNVNPNQPAAPAPRVVGEPGGHPVKQATQPNPPQRAPGAPQAGGLPRAGAGLHRPNPQQAPQAAPVAQKVNNMSPSKKEIAAEIVINLIGQDLGANLLTQKFDPEGTADKALASLKDHGIDAPWLSNNFTLVDMKAVAKAKGMPDALDPYLERFHKHVWSKWNVAKAAETVPVTNPS